MKTIQKLSTFILLLTLFTGVRLSAQAAQSKMKTIKILTSAECDMCKDRLEKEVSLMKGVKKAELDLATKVLTVEYNPEKTSPEKIRTAIAAIGYDADEVKANNRASKKLPQCCQKPDSAQ
jgi:periplasmic mercuric ion binding protein